MEGPRLRVVTDYDPNILRNKKNNLTTWRSWDNTSIYTVCVLIHWLGPICLSFVRLFPTANQLPTPTYSNSIFLLVYLLFLFLFRVSSHLPCPICLSLLSQLTICPIHFNYCRLIFWPSVPPLSHFWSDHLSQFPQRHSSISFHRLKLPRFLIISYILL